MQVFLNLSFIYFNLVQFHNWWLVVSIFEFLWGYSAVFFYLLIFTHKTLFLNVQGYIMLFFLKILFVRIDAYY